MGALAASLSTRSIPTAAPKPSRSTPTTTPSTRRACGTPPTYSRAPPPLRSSSPRAKAPLTARADPAPKEDKAVHAKTRRRGGGTAPAASAAAAQAAGTAKRHVSAATRLAPTLRAFAPSRAHSLLLRALSAPPRLCANLYRPGPPQSQQEPRKNFPTAPRPAYLASRFAPNRSDEPMAHQPAPRTRPAQPEAPR